MKEIKSDRILELRLRIYDSRFMERLNNIFQGQQQHWKNKNEFFINLLKNTKRRSEYSTKVMPYLEDIKRYISCGVTEGQCCEFYKIGRTSWAKYKKDNPELTETLCNAKLELKTTLINLAFKTAEGFWYEETKIITSKDKKGVILGTKETKHRRYARPDAGMIEFLLINRFPRDFTRDPQALELRKKAIELAERGKMSLDVGSI